MIQLRNVSVAFGGQHVLRNVSWSIPDGQRVGLIGPNGAGKTTLLRVITKQLQPDSGEVDYAGATVGYLEQDVQETASAATSVRDAALQAFDDVRRLEAEEHKITQQLAEHEDHTSEAYLDLLHRLDAVQQRLVAREAHRARPKTDAVLTGLGFEPDDLDRPLRTFSGGWRMRAALARLLLRQPDVLLLDEPTNHLDIDTIGWMEDYLHNYPGTVVVVSHDRFFLDRMVNHIAELQRGRVDAYVGNYSHYLEAREERRALYRARYENQQREIKEIERFIERFRYKATKAKQAQSRIKQLEKMDRLEPPEEDLATVSFRFPPPPRAGRTVLELSRFSKTYDTAEGHVEVFDDAGPLHIERGDKIALVGPNGAGKSTLARMLLGTEPFEGEREEGMGLVMAHFAQHQADTLDPDQDILGALRSVGVTASDTELRTLAGAFLFTGEDVFKRCGVLSGGERSRVALMRTLLRPSNLLLLDEPTNHLDIQSINVLAEALQQYEGTFVVVSHDRHFLDEVAQRIWRVEHGRVDDFPGTYAEYRWSQEHGTSAQVKKKTASNGQAKQEQKPETERNSGPKTKEQKRREAEERKRLKKRLDHGEDVDLSLLNSYQVRQLYDGVEASILKKERRKEELEKELADPSVYEDADQSQDLLTQHADVQSELKELYDRWETLAEAVG